MTNLIVATWHNLFVMQDSAVVEHLSPPGYGHYGITWNDDYLFALFASTCVLDGTGQFIRVYDKELRPVDDILHDSLAGVHQIQWHDGYLWVVNTNYDTVLACTQTGAVKHEHYLAPGYDPEEMGKHHINSIWFNDGFCYIVSHGLRNGEPCILKYSYPELLLVDKIPSAVNGHNVAIVDDTMITLLPGMIGRIGKAPIAIGGEIQKGLAVGDSVYLGSSRNIKDRAERRQDIYGKIYALSRDFSVQDEYNLDMGPVNEIRILDSPDLAHHGRPWTGKYGVNDA